MSTDTTPFTAIPWCARLLAAPNLRILTPPSRTPKPLTGEDSLFATTLATPSTITAAISYYPRPAPTDTHINVLNTLLKLSDGLNGFPKILHGGITATIIDEVIGILLTINADREHVRAVATGHATGETPEGLETYTVELKVGYKAPVRTPGVVLVKSRVVKREGRKIWVRASVVQKSGQEAELDGQMVECAVGEGLFVTPRAGRL